MHKGKKTTNDHWSKLNEKGNMAGLKIMLAVFKFGGRPLFHFILYFVIFFYFLFAHKNRAASQEYLNQLYQHTDGKLGLTKKPGLWDSYRHFYAFGDSILDKLASWTGKIKYQDLKFSNYHCMTDLQKQKKGGVIISAHLGNMEICRAISEIEDKYPLVILMHTKNAVRFNKIISELNPDSEISIVQVDNITPDVAIMLKETIDSGGFLVVLADRTPVSQNQQTKKFPFLGRDAAFPKGPFIMAGLFDCPVLLMFCLKEGKNYHLFLEHFSDSLKTKREKREEKLDQTMGNYVDRLSYYVKRYPYQWYNFYRYWD